MKKIPLLAAALMISVAACHAKEAENLKDAGVTEAKPAAVSAPGEHPVVGAIRWDAWTGGRVTKAVEKTLGPQKYHFRLPWFARVESDGGVHIDGSPQAVMDREIAFAADAGLDYWAFVLYPEKDPMSHALGNYLQSRARERLHFCVILHNSILVPAGEWPGERDRALALLKEPGYQTVLGGTPARLHVPRSGFQRLVSRKAFRGIPKTRQGSGARSLLRLHGVGSGEGLPKGRGQRL